MKKTRAAAKCTPEGQALIDGGVAHIHEAPSLEALQGRLA
jgi:hypothetical protein